MIGAEDELEGLTLEERVNVAFYESCHRSVIHIETRGDSESFLGRITSTEGSGSGSVWDSEGHILTNYHVIKGAQLLTVTLQDGSQFEARLAGNDITNDIAVLKIERENASLWPVTPGPSKKLRVGQRVFALGSSLGLEQTITVGSVNRTIQSLSKRMMKSIIQIDTKPPKESLGITLLWARLDRWAVYSQRFKQGAWLCDGVRRAPRDRDILDGAYPEGIQAISRGLERSDHPRRRITRQFFRWYSLRSTTG